MVSGVNYNFSGKGPSFELLMGVSNEFECFHHLFYLKEFILLQLNLWIWKWMNEMKRIICRHFTLFNQLWKWNIISVKKKIQPYLHLQSTFVQNSFLFNVFLINVFWKKYVLIYWWAKTYSPNENAHTT